MKINSSFFSQVGAIALSLGGVFSLAELVEAEETERIRFGLANQSEFVSSAGNSMSLGSSLEVPDQYGRSFISAKKCIVGELVAQVETNTNTRSLFGPPTYLVSPDGFLTVRFEEQPEYVIHMRLKDYKPNPEISPQLYSDKCHGKRMIVGSTYSSRAILDINVHIDRDREQEVLELVSNAPEFQSLSLEKSGEEIYKILNRVARGTGDIGALSEFSLPRELSKRLIIYASALSSSYDGITFAFKPDAQSLKAPLEDFRRMYSKEALVERAKYMEENGIFAPLDLEEKDALSLIELGIEVTR